MGHKESKFKKVFEDIDTSGDKKVSLQELVNYFDPNRNEIKGLFEGSTVEELAEFSQELMKKGKFLTDVYKKIETVVKQGTHNWGYNKKINIKLHVRLLMYSIYFFTIQQQVFGADKIEKFNMNDVINTAVDNFLHGIKT